MRSTVSVVWGLLLVLVGISLLGWIGYNLFVERQPEAEGRNPLVPSLFGLAITVIGVTRIRQGFAGRGEA